MAGCQLRKHKKPPLKPAGEQLKTQAYSVVPWSTSSGTVASLNSGQSGFLPSKKVLIVLIEAVFLPSGFTV
jgi:hypothetical protein